MCACVFVCAGGGVEVVGHVCAPGVCVPCAQRYELLLSELQKHTPETHPDHAPLGLALASVKTVGHPCSIS